MVGKPRAFVHFFVFVAVLGAVLAIGSRTLNAAIAFVGLGLFFVGSVVALWRIWKERGNPEANTFPSQLSVEELKRKKALPAVGRLRLEIFTEGLCAQVLHIGPFSEEGPTIRRVHEFIGVRSALAGKHHEIYLSDVRRADPAKWKTVIRQPME